MNLVDAKYRGVTKRAEIVIFMAPVPDNDILKPVAGELQRGAEIHVQRIEAVFLAQIHDHDRAGPARFQYSVRLAKDRGQTLKERLIITGPAQVCVMIPVIALPAAVGRALRQKDIPVGR